MTDLRLLMLCPYVPEPLQHGGRMRSRMFANTLARLGDVTLAVPVRSDLPGSDPAGSDTMAHAETLAEAFAGRVIPLPVEDVGASSATRKLLAWAKRRPDLLERRWSAKAKAIVRDLLADQRFDAVFADSSFVLPLLPEADPTPLVLNLHNVESHLLLRPGDVVRKLSERISRRIEARLLARAECAAARRAQLTLAISALDAERLRALEPRAHNIEVLENSVDAHTIDPVPWPPTIDQPLLLYVGGYDYGPNREAAESLVLEHLPQLRREWPDVRVRMIGRDHNDAIARLVQGQGGVEALGRVDDLRPHYQDATAVYLPIRTGGGTRGKILEAFAYGRPVIASTLGAEGFAITDRAEYLRADSPAEGVAAVRLLLDGGAPKLIERARTFLLSRHTHEAVANRLRELMLEYVRPRG